MRFCDFDFLRIFAGALAALSVTSSLEQTFVGNVDGVRYVTGDAVKLLVRIGCERRLSLLNTCPTTWATASPFPAASGVPCAHL